MPLSPFFSQELNDISLAKQYPRAELEKIILDRTPYLEHENWSWMGFAWRERTGYERPVNNWNPWIHSNVITCALLMEHNPQRRLDILYKCMDSLDNFILPYPADGGCDEGPSYWSRAGASLYDCLELLHSASDGRIDVFDHQLIKNIGTFIYKAYIDAPYFINFADASAKMNIDAPIVYRYGTSINNETMIKFAAFSAQQQGLGSDALDGSFGILNRVLPALFTLNELLMTEPAEPFIRDVWLPDIQVMAAWSIEGSSKGFYLAAKGGHNDESHNHNDIGNFIIYFDGEPLLIDAGAQTYTAKTFNSQRYELWNNQSAYHNVPTINSVMQKEGHQYRAKNVTHKASARKTEFSLDISGAYPEEAHVTSWQRQITLNREKNVMIRDAFTLDQAIKPVEFHFLTPLKINIKKPGTVLLIDGASQKSYSMDFDPALELIIETITIDDGRMSRSWGEQLYRLTLISPESLNGDFSFKLHE